MKKGKIIKRLILLLLIISLPIVLYIISIIQSLDINISSLQNSSNYKIIKQDINEKYSGIGQEKIENKDGYFTTFTTTDNKTYKEYKQNGTASWSEKYYWSGIMSEKGCGITAISVILSGYNKNYTPEDLRTKYSPVLNSEQISKELSSTFGIKNTDFFYDAKHLSNSYIEKHLKSDRPVLICVWNKPNNNRWTTTSHYMVLLATDGMGKVYLSNPNGLENTAKSSGWYDINEITPYIAKALYIESYK